MCRGYGGIMQVGTQTSPEYLKAEGVTCVLVVL